MLGTTSFWRCRLSIISQFVFSSKNQSTKHRLELFNLTQTMPSSTIHTRKAIMEERTSNVLATTLTILRSKQSIAYAKSVGIGGRNVLTRTNFQTQDKAKVWAKEKAQPTSQALRA